MLTSLILLFLQSGTWMPIPPMPTPRQEVGVAAVEGRVYVVGGLDASVAGRNTLEIFDTRAGQWVAGPPLPIGIHHAAIAAVGTRIYVAGGYSSPSNAATAATFELDIDQMVWVRKADMPTARGAGAAAAYNGRFYVFGGERAGTTVPDSAVFDPSTNSWSRIAPMPTPRNHMGAAVVRGKIYVIGGRPGNLGVNEAYNPATDTWISHAPMPTPRSGHAVASLSDTVFAFGGEGNPNSPIGIFQEVEAYHPHLDSWTALQPMALARHGIGAAPVGNRIFVPAGATVQGVGVTAGSDYFAVSQDQLIPQFVVGGGYSTSITVTNPEQSRAAEVTLSLTSVSGEPLEANLNGNLSSRVSFTVPPLASRTVLGADPSASIRVGTARVTSSTLTLAYGLVRGVGPQLTVYPAAVSRNVIFDVRRSVSAGATSGVAIANVSGQPVTITVRFHAESGQETARVERTLERGEQLSRFVHQLFPQLENADFSGTLTVRSTGQLAVAALTFDPTGVVTIPVAPVD